MILQLTQHFRDVFPGSGLRGETGTGLIPTGHSDHMLRPAVSPSSKLETSDGVELSKEVVMKTGNQIQETEAIRCVLFCAY